MKVSASVRLCSYRRHAASGEEPTPAEYDIQGCVVEALEEGTAYNRHATEGEEKEAPKVVEVEEGQAGSQQLPAHQNVTMTAHTEGEGSL